MSSLSQRRSPRKGTVDSKGDEADLATAWFLGPKAENEDLCRRLLLRVFVDYVNWRRNYHAHDPIVLSRRTVQQNQDWNDRLEEELDQLLNNLKAHFPFYSPRYIAHMLSEQTIPSVLGYFAAMLYNPNNVTTEAAPVTVALELEVGKLLAEMVGFNKNKCWAHLCSGGTLANIEALWVARTVQFLPFIIQEFCTRENFTYEVTTPNGRKADLDSLAPRDLISLNPSLSISLITSVPIQMSKTTGKPLDQVLTALNSSIRESEYNPALRGFYKVLRKVGLTPVIFVSAAAHYSIRKAANVLGYGEDSVDLISVNSWFRLDVKQLQDRLFNLPDDKYVAAVIGTVGTTEEGAVDPVHQMHFLRSFFSKERNRSFWLHVDAAWGGYFASLFRGSLPEEKMKLDDLLKACSERLKIRESFTLSMGQPKQVKLKEEIAWEQFELYRAFLALCHADSITIDPHKMGYVPYPAGLAAFKDGRVTELLAQRAQYISKRTQAVEQVADELNITEVGSYIIEGSKPGAAAAACWLAHKTIPLDASGHGILMRNVLLSAQRLHRYLWRHEQLFDEIDQECFPGSPATQQFTFLPICSPDTNIVCFVARPMAKQQGKLIPIDKDLDWKNSLNSRIHRALSIDATGESVWTIHSREFFVSRTKFENSQYRADSLEYLLAALSVSVDEYKRDGLVVLRATVMNPFYSHAGRRGKDFLFEFVKCLHKVARQSAEELCRGG